MTKLTISLEEIITKKATYSPNNSSNRISNKKCCLCFKGMNLEMATCLLCSKIKTKTELDL